MATHAPAPSVSPARDATNSRPNAFHGRPAPHTSAPKPQSHHRDQGHRESQPPRQRKHAAPRISLSPRHARTGRPSAPDIAKRKLERTERQRQRGKQHKQQQDHQADQQEPAQQRQRRRSETINGTSDRSPSSERYQPPAATSAKPDHSYAQKHVSFAKPQNTQEQQDAQGAEHDSRPRREEPSVPESSTKTGHIICVTSATSSEASSPHSSQGSNESTASVQVHSGKKEKKKEKKKKKNKEPTHVDASTADMSRHLKALVAELYEAATEVASRPALSSSDKDLIAVVQKQADRINILISASTSSKRLQQEIRATSKAILAAAPVANIEAITAKFNAFCDLAGVPASSRIKSNPPSPLKKAPAHSKASGSTSAPASPEQAEAERQAKATALMRRLIRKKTEKTRASKESPSKPAKPSGLRQSVSMETIRRNGADAQPTEKPRQRPTHTTNAAHEDKHEHRARDTDDRSGDDRPAHTHKHKHKHKRGEGGDEDEDETEQRHAVESDQQHAAHASPRNGASDASHKPSGRSINGTHKGTAAKEHSGPSPSKTKEKKTAPGPTRLTAEALAVQQELVGDDCPIGRMRVNMVDDETQLHFPRGSHGEIRYAEHALSSSSEEDGAQEEQEAPRGRTAVRRRGSSGDDGSGAGLTEDKGLNMRAEGGEDTSSIPSSPKIPPGSVVEGGEYLVDGLLACKLMYIGPLTEQRARRNLKRLNRAERREREEPLSDDEDGVDEVAVYPGNNVEAWRTASGKKQRVWCGVMYLKKRHGNNNGTINGMRFFECDNGYGEFLHPSRLKEEPAGTDAKFMQPDQELLSEASSTTPSTGDAASNSDSSGSLGNGAGAADYDVVSLDAHDDDADDENRDASRGTPMKHTTADPSPRVAQSNRRMSMDAYGNLVRHPSVVLTDEDGSVLIDFIAGTGRGVEQQAEAKQQQQQQQKGKKRAGARVKRKSIEPQDVEQQAVHLAAAAAAAESGGGGEDDIDNGESGEHARAAYSAPHAENAAAAAGTRTHPPRDSDGEDSVGAFAENTGDLPRVPADRVIAGPEPAKPKRTEVELMQELDTVQVTLEALRRESERKDKVIDRLEEQLQQARRLNDGGSEDGDSVILAESAGHTDRLRADLDRQVRLAAMNKEYIAEMEEQLEAKNAELQAIKSELESLREDSAAQALTQAKDELTEARERVRQLETELEMIKAEKDVAAAAAAARSPHQDNANHRSFVDAPPSPIAPVQGAASPEPSFREADTPVSPVVAEIDRMVRNSLERSRRVEESFRARVLRSTAQAGSILSPLAAGDKENATPGTSTPSRRLPGSPRFRGTPPAVRWSSRTMEEKDKEIEQLKDKLAEVERENEELRSKTTQASLLLDAERKQASARETHIASFAASSFNGNETFATARDASLLTSLMDMSDEELNRLQENKISSLRKVVQNASRVLQSMEGAGVDVDFDAADKSFDLGPSAHHKRSSSESEGPLSIARCSSGSFDSEGPQEVGSASTHSGAGTDSADGDERRRREGTAAAASGVGGTGGKSRKKRGDSRESETKHRDEGKGARESQQQQKQQQQQQQHQVNKEQGREAMKHPANRQSIGSETTDAEKGREHQRAADRIAPSVDSAAAAAAAATTTATTTATSSERTTPDEEQAGGKSAARRVTLNLGSDGDPAGSSLGAGASMNGTETDEEERRDRVSSPLRKSPTTTPRGRKQKGRRPSLKRQDTADTRRSSDTSMAAAARRRALRRVSTARRSSMQSSNSLHSSMVDAAQGSDSDTSSVSSQDDVNAYVEDKARSQVVSNRDSFMEDNDPHEYFESGGSDDDEMAETLKKLEAVNERQQRNAGFFLGVRSPSVVNSNPGSQRSSNMYHYEFDDDGLTESASMLTVPLSRATSAYDLELQSYTPVSPSEVDAPVGDSLHPGHSRGRAPSVESVLVLQDLSHLHRLICNCDIENVDRCPKIRSLRADPTAQANLHPQVCQCTQTPDKCQLLQSILSGAKPPHPIIKRNAKNVDAGGAGADGSALAPKIVLTSARSSQESIYRFEHEEEGGQKNQQQEGDGEAGTFNGELNARSSNHGSPRSSGSGPDNSKATHAGVQLLRRQVSAEEKDDDSITSVHTSASQQRLSIDLGLVSAQEAAETTGAATTSLQKRLTEGQGGGWWSRKLKSKATVKKASEPQEEGEKDGAAAQSPETKAPRGASLFRSKIRAVAFAASKKPPAKAQLAKFKKYASIHDFASTEDGESRAGVDAAILRDLNEMDAERVPEAADSVFGLSRRGSRRASTHSAGSAATDTSKTTKASSAQQEEGGSVASSETGRSDSTAPATGEGKEDTQTTTTFASFLSGWRLKVLIVALLILAAVLALAGAVIAFPEETWTALEMARRGASHGREMLQNTTHALLPRVDHVPVWIPRAN